VITDDNFADTLWQKIESTYGHYTRQVHMEDLGQVLAPFLPSQVLQHALSQQSLSPATCRIDGVVFLADISGFTRMCEQFAGGHVPLSSILSEETVDKLRSSDAGYASSMRINNSMEAQGVGAEGVRNVLNLYFRRLIEVIEEFLGDGVV
jgi:class 3 adenylate cyclase